MRSREGTRRAFLLAVPLFGLLVGCAIAEGVLRLADVSYPIFTQPDPVLGWKHVPGTSGWFRGEGRTFIEINGEGWRDRERVEAKPDGVFRIAVLGDSFAEAFQVPLDATFWSVLERRLARCRSFDGTRVEVLNFGVAGYGTAQELLALRHHVWSYEPDLVMLAFFASNDVRNNSRPLEGGMSRPYFVLRDDELVLDDSFRESRAYARQTSTFRAAMRTMIARARILQLVYQLRRRWQIARLVAADPDILRLQGNPVFSAPRSRDWEAAWRVTERLFTTVRDEVEARGADFYLVTVPDAHQAHPDRMARVEFMRVSDTTNLFYPDRRVHEFGLSKGIKVITLADRFLGYASRTGTCLHGSRDTDACVGHWNEVGHRLAGDLVAERICRDYASAP